jgi:multidrug efflux system membrane fusion protein
MRARPRLPALLLTALAIGPALSGCLPSKAATAPVSAPLATVTVEVPGRSLVQEKLDFTARIEPAHRVEVRSRVSGYLTAITFREGNRAPVPRRRYRFGCAGAWSPIAC